MDIICCLFLTHFYLLLCGVSCVPCLFLFRNFHVFLSVLMSALCFKDNELWYIEFVAEFPFYVNVYNINIVALFLFTKFTFLSGQGCHHFRWDFLNFRGLKNHYKVNKHAAVFFCQAWRFILSMCICVCACALVFTYKGILTSSWESWGSRMFV